MLAVIISKTGTYYHYERYYFRENAWSWDDKTGKIIVTASGTIFTKMLRVVMTK